MVNMKVLFIGIGKPGFITELGKDLYKQSINAVSNEKWHLVVSEDLITDPDKGEELAIKEVAADCVIIQFSTFNDARFAMQIMKHFQKPVMLWCLPEPKLGGRLQLNSLTGLNAASFALNQMHKKYSYVYTLPDRNEVKEVLIWLETVYAIKKLRSAVLGRIGEYPPGFYASDADQTRLIERFGIKVDKIDLEEVINLSEKISDEDVDAFVSDLKKEVSGIDQINSEQVRKSTKVTLALKKICEIKKFSSIAVRCWPEFIRDYGAAVCHSTSHISDLGIPAACESDILGSATMLFERYLSNGAGTFIGDLVHIDKERNSAIFWHCGYGPTKLASRETGPVAGVQPNRGIGLAMNNSLMGGQVTVARISRTDNDYRILVMEGQALDVPNRFQGVSVEIQFKMHVKDVLDKLIYDGYEFHYAIVWSDVSKHLINAGRILDIPVEHIM